MQPSTEDAHLLQARQLARQVEQFLAAGGRVQKLPIIRRDSAAAKVWTRSAAKPGGKKTMKDLADKHCRHPGGDTRKASKTFAQQCQDKRNKLAPQVIAMSSQGHTVVHIAGALKVSTGNIERIRREHGLSRKRKD